MSLSSAAPPRRPEKPRTTLPFSCASGELPSATIPSPPDGGADPSHGPLGRGEHGDPRPMHLHPPLLLLLASPEIGYSEAGTDARGKLPGQFGAAGHWVPEVQQDRVGHVEGIQGEDCFSEIPGRDGYEIQRVGKRCQG